MSPFRLLTHLLSSALENGDRVLYPHPPRNPGISLLLVAPF